MNPTVTIYIQKQPSHQQEKLQELRSFLGKLLPAADEVMSYGVPAFKQNGKTIMYAAFKAHIGLYPTPKVIEAFTKELADYHTSKGAITFPLTQPLPLTLIQKIVEYLYADDLK